ncbi:helix-turn-helix domain-containing protein [Paenibacillus sp. P26]|nr:helix-turn-helix domain-containing protein [Paenibacillus sp. P26]
MQRRPISDVAVDAGFYDQSHFTRMFAHFVGVTPQKYAVSQ